MSPEVDFLSCISPWVVAENMGPLGPLDWLQDLSQVAGPSRLPYHQAMDKLEIMLVLFTGTIVKNRKPLTDACYIVHAHYISAQ